MTFPTFCLTTQDILSKDGKVAFREVLSDFPEETRCTLDIIKDMEKSNQIVEYDLTVIRSIISQMNYLPKNNIYSINLSGATLSRYKEITALVSKGDFSKRIIFELTETVAPTIKSLLCFIEQMRKIGVRIALDDINHNPEAHKILDISKPDILKFVLDDSLDEFFHYSTKVPYFVIEEVSSLDEAISIWKTHSKALLQGYCLDRPSPLTKW